MMRSLVAGLLAIASGAVPGDAAAQRGSIEEAMRARMQARVEAGGGVDRPDRAGRGPDAGGWQRPERPRGEVQRDDRPNRAELPAPTRDGNRDDPQRGAAHPDRERAADAPTRGADPARPRGDERRWEDRRGDPSRDGRREGARDPRRGADGRAGRDRDRNWRARRWDGHGPDWDRIERDWRDRDDFAERRAWNWRSDLGRDAARRTAAGWDRGWREDRRYDWSGYRSTNRAAYHLPRYYAPYGWSDGYRRFAVGARIAPVIFAPRYWIDDPFSYRLPEPWGPYRWVRYYNDAVLVDIDSGEVVDTIVDLFW